MNKICTDIDQSKKLTELGIDINTADIIYNILDISYIRHDAPIDKYHMPAWSFSALEGLMPFQIIENNQRYGFYQVKGFNKQGETYRFGYKTNNDSFLFETSWYNDVIDAAFDMVCWLKENNKNYE